MKYFFLLLVFLLVFPLNTPAQKVLQLERANRARTVKIPIGASLTYKIREPDAVWEQSDITDLDVEGQRIRLGLLWYKVSDIDILKRQKSGGVRGLGAMLGVFGISWVGYSAIGRFLYNDRDVSWSTAAIIAGTTLPAAWWMTRPRKLKMGEVHRLRVLDVTYPGVQQGQAP